MKIISAGVSSTRGWEFLFDEQIFFSKPLHFTIMAKLVFPVCWLEYWSAFFIYIAVIGHHKANFVDYLDRKRRSGSTKRGFGARGRLGARIIWSSLPNPSRPYGIFTLALARRNTRLAQVSCFASSSDWLIDLLAFVVIDKLWLHLFRLCDS